MAVTRDPSGDIATRLTIASGAVTNDAPASSTGPTPWWWYAWYTQRDPSRLMSQESQYVHVPGCFTSVAFPAPGVPTQMLSSQRPIRLVSAATGAAAATAVTNAVTMTSRLVPPSSPAGARENTSMV